MQFAHNHWSGRQRSVTTWSRKFAQNCRRRLRPSSTKWALIPIPILISTRSLWFTRRLFPCREMCIFPRGESPLGLTLIVG